MNGTTEAHARPSPVLAARWRPPAGQRPRPELATARHLIIVHHGAREAAIDWTRIAQHVADIDPRIGVFVVDGRNTNSYTRRRAATLPTVLCSPRPQSAFRIARGKAFFGRPLPRFERLRMLTAAGVPVPRTRVFSADGGWTTQDWGHAVVLKPAAGTGPTRFAPTGQLAEMSPGEGAPLLVQRFIDTGPRPSVIRVVTLFGEPLHALALPGRAAADHAAARSGPEAVALVEDGAVLDLARRLAAVVPEAPLVVCEMVRDAATGQLFVLDFDAAADDVLFGLPAGQEAAKAVRDLLRRTDPLRKAARILAAKTNAEAA